MKICVKCRQEKPDNAFEIIKHRHILKDGSDKVYLCGDTTCHKCRSKKRKSTIFKKQMDLQNRRADKINQIDVALSTEAGFDNLLKEFGL